MMGCLQVGVDMSRFREFPYRGSLLQSQNGAIQEVSCAVSNASQSLSWIPGVLLCRPLPCCNRCFPVCKGLSRLAQSRPVYDGDRSFKATSGAFGGASMQCTALFGLCSWAAGESKSQSGSGPPFGICFWVGTPA